MENLLNKLNTSVESKNKRDILNSLKLILVEGEKVEIKNGDVFIKLLQSDIKVQKLSAEVIAELGKNENNRRVLTDKEIINKLMEFLQCKDNDIVFLSIRALGNICYENKEACDIIDQRGIDSIVAVLKNDNERKDNTLTTKACGLLVNLLSTHDDLPKTAIKCGILPVIKEILIKYKGDLISNQMLLMFALSILNHIVDYFDDQTTVFTEDLAKITVDIMKQTENPEISVCSLEIIHGQAEKDEIKSLLARENVCELLYELIEKYRPKVNDEETRSVMKMACDLIVIILTGDYGMNLLYDNGKGKTYLNMLKWLDSDDSDLLSTGVLALGNFARKDTHCIEMVKNGISRKLIGLLSQYNTSTNMNDIKIQHALLSTLKNLVIPKENKEPVLKENLIEVIYPMIKHDRYTVVFKLLGTFRMVIDGQEGPATDLLSRREFIERLVYWCYNSDHLGVRGEVPRLFAWLIKHSRSTKPYEIFLSVKDSVRCLVEMISSNHGVMQNEAFYALNLLCISLGDGDTGETLYKSIVRADIGKNLNFVINKYGDKWDAKTIENLLTLLDYLVKSKVVVEHLELTKIDEALAKLQSNDNAKGLSDKLNIIVISISP